MLTPITEPARRNGAETRAAIQRIAFDLFTSRGYEATSMREIADELGIRKASLYYHFKGKDDILRSLFEQRGNEAEELLDWIRQQPQNPALVRAAVLRWVESFPAEKLRGIRFLAANPLLARSFERATADRIGSTLTTIVDKLAQLLPDQNPVAVLRLRMALLSINAAIDAAANDRFPDAEILAAARASATTAVDALLYRKTHIADDAML